MSGKRLRIRVRPRLSEINIEWLAGQEDGFKKGVAQGKAYSDRQYVDVVGQLRKQIAQLQKDVTTANAATQINERTAEKYRKRVLVLEQETALLRQPMKSDWLSVPPFLMPEQTDDSWIANAQREFTKTGRHAANYGGFPMIVRPDRGRTAPIGFLRGHTMAQGGILSPELSNRFLERILNSPGILSQVRTVPMRPPSFAEGGLIRPLRPPGDPIFHWNADLAQEVDGQPLTELENHADPSFSERVEMSVREVRAAHRLPMLVGSEMRSPEAEEGVRQASAEGVTDEAGGHSHTIDLEINVDDTELRNVVSRMDELVEAVGNVGVSAEDFARMLARIGNLEARMGPAEDEESPSETDFNALGGACSQGGEDQD